MTCFTKALLGLLALIVASFAGPAAQPAQAAQQVLCAPDPASGSVGPKRVVNPNTNNAYSINAAGCAPIAVADIGYFLSQGYTPGPNTTSTVYSINAASSTTDYVVATIPPGSYIRDIFVQNTTATAVSGGIQFGSTANATDIVTALTCGANCLTNVTDANLKVREFSTTASQQIHASAASTWQGASVIITVIWGYF